MCCLTKNTCFYAGEYSPDGNAANCRSSTGPLLLRRVSSAYPKTALWASHEWAVTLFHEQAWYVAGQKAVASVRLPPPWDKEFVVARVSPLGAGQLLVVNEHNAPYELAGSPLAASTGATQTGANPGPSVLLGRLTGLAAFSRYLQLT